jgi:hypothetical protein
LLLVQSKALDEAPYKLSGAVAKLASITFSSLAFSYWFDKPWFFTEGKLAAVLIIPSSWGSQLGDHLHQHRTAITEGCTGWCDILPCHRCCKTHQIHLNKIPYHYQYGVS